MKQLKNETSKYLRVQGQAQLNT
uniref:Uncharacterized protein n=1 Tax=Rhizophora mucronata TaxID=61149 RepID=A0A2P2N9L1_RHIMU